jgi:hypothetical protein
MCAIFETGGVRRKPGSVITAWRAPLRTISLPWTGFARHEILEWWMRRGYEPVDVPAERFAVRSNISEELVWSDLPGNRVLRAIAHRKSGELRMATCAATAEELLHFQHERMPVVDEALFSAERPPAVGLPLFEIPRRSRRRLRPAEAVQEMLL